MSQWKYDYDEQEIINGQARGCLISFVVCLLLLLLMTYPIIASFSEVFGETVILKSTSPNREYTLIVKKKNSHLHHQAFTITTEGDGLVTALAELDVNQVNNPVSIEWFENDKAMIEIIYGDTIQFTAPNLFNFEKQ